MPYLGASVMVCFCTGQDCVSRSAPAHILLQRCTGGRVADRHPLCLPVNNSVVHAVPRLAPSAEARGRTAAASGTLVNWVQCFWHRRCLDAMETYGEEGRRAFEHTLGWLHQ